MIRQHDRWFSDVLTTSVAVSVKLVCYLRAADAQQAIEAPVGLPQIARNRCGLQGPQMALLAFGAPLATSPDDRKSKSRRAAADPTTAGSVLRPAR